MSEKSPMTSVNEAPDPELDSSATRIAQLAELGIGPTADERIAQLRTVTGEGLANMAKSIHEIVAPDVAHTPHEAAMHIQSPDGSNRRTLLSPDQREGHLQHAAELVRSLTELPATDDTQKRAILRRAGNVVALSIVQAHIYSDGNGRTARTMAQLIREGIGEPGSEEQADLLLASQNRPESGFRIHSFLPTGEGLDLEPSELLDRAAALSIPMDDVIGYRAVQEANFSSPYSD